MIPEFKDVIGLKQFFWEQEELFEKTRERKYLLTQSFNKMTLSEICDNYCAEYVFKIDYKNDLGRVDFHGWSITNTPITLVSYKRIVWEYDDDN